MASLYKRIDSLALCYGLCVKIAQLRPSAVPLTLSFPLSGSIDAFMTGEDGFCIGIMRKGNTLAFSDFRKRFWAVTEGKGFVHQQRRGPPLTLVIVPSSFEKKWFADRIAELYSRRMFCAIATEYEATEFCPMM